MMVMIRTGQYRIGSTYYTLDGIACDSSDYKINMGGKMDKTAGVLNIDSASTGDFRTDIIVVGDDNILDVVKGTTYT
ncbi:MAG: hypothetical protein GWN62_05975, partial [Aliifodinibius sp.]|nr:hypothetical protein [Fodinibius sp.]